MADRKAAVDEQKALLLALRAEASRVSYGSAQASPEDRDKYVRAYGCVAWTEAALDTVASMGPLVEVGAGAGQWACALRTHDADVIAYDDGSDVPLPAPAKANPVILGVDGAAAAAKHADRALLMVAPPPGPQPTAWLSAYRGSKLAYVGEGRGGANADHSFFASLERDWLLERTITLQPYPGGCERLWILARKAAQ